MAEFEVSIATVLKHEGTRFVDDKDDPGGATKYGISLRFLKDFGARNDGVMAEFDIDHDGDIDANDIMLLDEKSAKKLYRMAFWDTDKLGYVNSQLLATKLIDVSVHCGPSRMRRWTLPASHDEMHGFGDQAILRINATLPDTLIRQVRTKQIAHYHACVARRPSSIKYLAGWLKRAEA